MKNENDSKIEPLIEWNRLARENTEDAIVSSMFEAAAKASEPLESFSTWLLVGTAAIASFLITNSDRVIPFLSLQGFSVCGGLLCISCFFGLASKMFALRATILRETGDSTRKTFSEHLKKYEEEQLKINESAAFWGISLETGIRIERILAEFYKPLPKWAVWLAKNSLKKHAGNPQIGYLSQVNNLTKQGYCSTLQAMGFLGFLISGVVYAATI